MIDAEPPYDRRSIQDIGEIKKQGAVFTGLPVKAIHTASAIQAYTRLRILTKLWTKNRLCFQPGLRLVSAKIDCLANLSERPSAEPAELLRRFYRLAAQIRGGADCPYRSLVLANTTSRFSRRRLSTKMDDPLPA